ncbi:Cyclic di-GMP phosphodiesterase response regulator RpfG [Fundidesulfovibrio magnetotacticus]|uniref:Cyclic di-GMP phosphodiesterase response regulator RpfG n=1 Tax=Fundidesulfovibrio magnetotacticus TaxID=2730080 RepID=A0A6V8LY89_9BACT|nr:HD domain-containing phosphohydrolase [Fundidesulfovibrio magnetotacticus]GFK95009.1 Cyclic di-GMP phosphodiesterase response regulator RpfG [Fundidesulfovibrio magnetotacticus]
MSARKILVVEDEAIVALDIKSRLKRMGYEVAGSCATGEEAVALVGRLKPDLVLMDIMLEGAMDGIEAAGEINEGFGLPVVYLTAYADKQTLDRAKITNPFGYIIKPFEDRELQTTIEMALYKFDAERTMRLSERWLATTLRNLGEAVVTAGSDGLIRFLNPVAERSLGLVQDAARELSLQDAFWKRTRPMDDAGPDKHLLRAADGGEIPVEIHLSPIIDDWGKDMGSVLVFRDISEQVRNERELRDSLDRLRVTLEATVGALAVTAEKRDPYTAGHQQRVAALACAMAHSLGLDEERSEGLRVAGLLHDIGKIYIPAEILAKPSRLNSIEMGLIKTHSEVGFDILKDVPFPWPVARMVLEHHERIDGTGYPGGLSDGQILEESKILSVADVVEAMSSHRPYRAALGLERALAEIRKNRGVLYDPACVDACVDLLESGRFSFETDQRLPV